MFRRAMREAEAVAREAFASTFDKVFTCYRYSNYIEDDITRKKKTVVLENVSCTISLRPNGVPNGVEQTTKAYYEKADKILYCLPDTPILEADIVEIDGRFYDVGTPYIYATHLEVKITLREAI